MVVIWTEINPDHPIDIFCVWCKKGFVLIPKEAWYDPYVCPSCKKIMGIPKVTSGSKRDPASNEMKPYWVADYYRFYININKGQVLPFIEKLHAESHGYILGIDPNLCVYGGKITRQRQKWSILVLVKSAFEFESVEWNLPPVVRAQ